MSELPWTQLRLQKLQRYMHAMECGDIETIAALLEEACHDRGLEPMLLEMNAVYQHEDATTVRASDAAAAQHLLLQIVNQTSGREEMEHSSLHSSEDPNDATSQSDAIEISSDTLATKKVQGKKFATPVFPARMVATPKWYSSRKSWIVACAAAVLIAILLVPGTSAMASQLLSFFTVKSFQTVQITKQDTTTLSKYSTPSIDDLGTVTFQLHSLQTRNNLTQEQAAKSVNFPLARPSQLPDGVSNSPVFSVIESGHGVFTFNTAKLHAYLVKNGHGNVQIPANLNGATFDVTTTPGVLLKYGYHGGNPFLVAELPSPVIRATGSASLEDLRTFLLSLPGLPPSLVAELKQINITNGTLPLLVPPGVNAQSVSVHGASGLMMTGDQTEKSEALKQFAGSSVLIWQTKGIIYAVGGLTTNTQQLLAAANSL